MKFNINKIKQMMRKWMAVGKPREEATKKPHKGGREVPSPDGRGDRGFSLAGQLGDRVMQEDSGGLPSPS